MGEHYRQFDTSSSLTPMYERIAHWLLSDHRSSVTTLIFQWKEHALFANPRWILNYAYVYVVNVRSGHQSVCTHENKHDLFCDNGIIRCIGVTILTIFWVGSEERLELVVIDWFSSSPVHCPQSIRIGCFWKCYGKSLMLKVLHTSIRKASFCLWYPSCSNSSFYKIGFF